MKYKRKSERERETYCRASKYVEDARKNKEKLSRAFTRIPYVLTLKQEVKNG